jgi:hypothetical protein
MITRRIKRFRRDKSGATALEFAMVAGPLLLLIFGVIEFSRAEWARQSLQDIAIHGARCMGVRQTACTTGATIDQAKIKTYLITEGQAFGLELTSDGITLESNVSCDGVAGFSRVSLAYDFSTAVPGLIEALLAKIPLRAHACFPNQPTP